MNYQLSPYLSVKRIDNEVFVLDRKNGQMHTFNSSAAFLWGCLERGVAVNELGPSLTASFEVEPASAQADAEAFVADCEKKNLLTILP